MGNFDISICHSNISFLFFEMLNFKTKRSMDSNAVFVFDQTQKKLPIHQHRQAQARSFDHDILDEKSKTDSDADAK